MSGKTDLWRLRRALELFVASDGDVYLLRGGSGAEHIIRAPSAEDTDLLKALARGGVRLAAGTPDYDRALPLIRAGAVVPAHDASALGADEAERFDRQLPYLEDFGDPVALQRRLRGARVAILGCGGLGTWALAALACTGIGEFVLVDDDEVSLSNLNRQVLYGSSDVGRRKVGRAAAWVRQFDRAISVEARPVRVRSSRDLLDLPPCDAWVLTADWPPYELARWVNEASLHSGVPFIIAGQQPPLVKVGPTFAPGRGASCFACHEEQMRSAFPLYDDVAAQRRSQAPSAATLGPASAIVGSMIASEVLHLIISDGPTGTLDRTIVLDTRTLETTSWPVDVAASCPVCA